MNTLSGLISLYPNEFNRIKNLSQNDLIKLHLQNYHNQTEKDITKRINKKINNHIRYKSNNTNTLNQTIKSRVKYNHILKNKLNEKNLENIPLTGNVQLRQPDFYDYENNNAKIYTSEIINNPTWLDIIYELHNLIVKMEHCRFIKTYKNIFIEEFTIVESNKNLTVIELILGSNF